ncbi:9241_t:CDS:2, partial [Gigaspora rosea]
DAHIEKYGTCEDLVGSFELQADIPSSTNPQIECSGTSLADISSYSLLDLDFQEESFITLNISNYEEEVAEIEPESDDEETIMDYSAPDIEKEDEVFENIDNLDNSFGWILIWILRYQQRYRLPDTATESLVKFMHYLLTYLDNDQFNNFPESLYLARKLMGLGLHINNYTPCLACDKLYEPKPELLRIILTNKCLDEIVSHADTDDRISNSLKILKGRISSGSMAIPDEFESQDLLQFYNLRNIISQGEAFGYKSFPGTFLDPKLENTILQTDIQTLLVEFYNDTGTGYQFTRPGCISGINEIAVFLN